MENNKAILLKANQHITDAEHEAFLSHCTDDVVWDFVGEQVLNGKQAVRNYIGTVYIDPPKFTVLDLIS